MRKLATGLITLVALAALPSADIAGAAKPKNAKTVEKKEEGPLSPPTFAGLALRGIGPALVSGRIVDFAVGPGAPAPWWIATASSGVWKSTNAGTTWTPVFDGEGSYSTGCVTVDPHNANVVWVGTGENNSQRSVSYGDGVYRTLDGGKSWKRMGLADSEHIGRIAIDARDSNTIWVAAQGPLWRAGGDRGLYKSTDGGETWKKSLDVGADTGVSEVVLDPRDPDILYAVAYQRRRHVWTLVDGGPGSAIYKSTDGGGNWRKLTSGLPQGDVGRIGIALSPADPDVVYAIVEASEEKGGVFRSQDRGESWEKRSSYVSDSPQYYQELFADPADVDRLYSMDTFLQVSDDGGTSWRNLGEKSKHVDNHVLWIDPDDHAHYVAGCDGGLYESFDRGSTWRFFENLPISQFYRVTLSERWPVYDVCGGTQDNNSLCGPSRTLSFQGPANEDWFITQGGDGFWSAVDPTNPDIIYSEAQYGVLTRFDRKSGENVDIQPQPAPGEDPFRWNWDAPVLLSPHSPTRLYFAANKLFRSDDRGDSWSTVSPDLTRQLDRNRLEVFGKIQPPEAVAKNASTSLFGNIVALTESPRVEGLLYVGTDDGLVQVSEDGGAAWRRIESFPGVPDRSYVSDLAASQHAADVVYASFDNHKMGDFKPYALRSGDRGRSWTSIAGDLPERGSVYSLAEDPVDPDLLFAGTEFGLFFTVDGGKKWVQLTGGLPTTAVRDIAIQKRDSDLVLASFGRGFWILDDISPLRLVDDQALESEALLFPVRKAWLYVPSSRIGDREKGFMGETFYLGDNPPYGATFTYYLKESWQSQKAKRQEAEKKALEAEKPIDYPSLETLRAEALEEEGKVVLTIRDADGDVVRRLETGAGKGIHRLSWNLRYPDAEPASKGGQRSPWLPPPAGPFAAPGTYTVRLSRVAGGVETPLAEPRSFEVDVLHNATLAAADRAAVLAFQNRVADLQRAVLGARRLSRELHQRLELVRAAIASTPALGPMVDTEARQLELDLQNIDVELSGDDFLQQRHENAPPSIVERVMNVVYGSWYTTAEPTKTQLDAYRYAGDQFARVLGALRILAGERLPALEQKLEQAGAPWTPGRIPEWAPEP